MPTWLVQSRHELQNLVELLQWKLRKPKPWPTIAGKGEAKITGKEEAESTGKGEAESAGKAKSAKKGKAKRPTSKGAIPTMLPQKGSGSGGLAAGNLPKAKISAKVNGEDGRETKDNEEREEEDNREDTDD